MYIICHSSDPQWLEERRKRITASDIQVFLGIQPSWFSDRREDLIAHKINRTRAEFKPDQKRRMRHGRAKEAVHLQMLGELTGYPVVPYGYLIGNTRWSHLGGTLDGLLFPYMQVEPDLTLTSQPDHVLSLIRRLSALSGPIPVELKNTDAHRFKERQGQRAGLLPWIDFPPDYHTPQVQTQLHLSGHRHGILSGMLGSNDLMPWYVEADEGWAGTMDEANDDAREVLGGATEAD